MSSVLFLNVLDVARSLGVEPSRSTPRQVSEWLLSEYLRRRGGGFNYNPAINATYDLFTGAGSHESARLHCLTHGNPKGRRQNVEAIDVIAPYALANISQCYRIGFTAVAIGRIGKATVYIGIKTPMVRIRDQEAFVVMPGYRMSYRPIEIEIDVACSIALANFARDDFEKADFEYLHAGPGLSGEREFRAIKGRDRTIFDRDQIDGFLDTYVNGVALAIEAGIELRAPDLKGYQIVDPNEPSLPF